MHTISLLVALALGPSGEAQNASEFLGGGTPTFVTATLGDEHADRGVLRQVEFIQGLLFPKAPLITDASFDAAAGPSAWPAHAVLYGGAHLNAALQAVAPCLPLRVDRDVVEIAGETYAGPEYRLIALVPPVEPTDDCVGSPQFLLYAGAGTPGVTEINSTPDGNHGFVVIDRFGVRDAGRWERDEAGAWTAVITRRELRKPWRTTRVAPDGEVPEPLALVHRLETTLATDAESAQDAAVVRGIERAQSKLGVAGVAPLEVHLYPSVEIKSAMTRSGDGHADVCSRTLHVLTLGAAEGGPLESIVAHEAVHVFAADAYGTPGSALWGEGLAVWASGQYGGKSLSAWRLGPPALEASVERLVGSDFFTLPERKTYPVAGLLVEDLIRVHGYDAFLEHVYPAGPDDLDAACAALGIKVDSLNAKLRRYRGG